MTPCEMFGPPRDDLPSFRFMAALGLSRSVQDLRCSLCPLAFVVLGLSCSAACGILVLRPGIEPTSPVLEGGFLTTGPPGKFQ